MIRILFIVLFNLVIIHNNLFAYIESELPLAHCIYYADGIVIAQVQNTTKISSKNINNNQDRLDRLVEFKVVKVLLGNNIPNYIEIPEYTDVGGSINTEAHYTNNELCILVLGKTRNGYKRLQHSKTKIHIQSLEDNEVLEMLKWIKWRKIKKFHYYFYNSKWFTYISLPFLMCFLLIFRKRNLSIFDYLFYPCIIIISSLPSLIIFSIDILRDKFGLNIQHIYLSGFNTTDFFLNPVLMSIIVNIIFLVELKWNLDRDKKKIIFFITIICAIIYNLIFPKFEPIS